MLELSFVSTEKRPFSEDHELKLSITKPNGQTMNIFGYWAGNNRWGVRFSSPLIGMYHYVTNFSDENETGLHGQTGSFEVIKYAGSNPLFQHGKLKASVDHKRVEHCDGTPFFWLGDTWWMGFTKRLSWPEEFQLLTQDRVQKEFTLIQIVAGLYPDMPPFDERGTNEKGYPWLDKKFEHINPVYFDMVDRRIQYLVESGLVPCIVGNWGYFLNIMGIEALKKHWKNLVARYSAYPVIWCIAGEAMMRYYLKDIPNFPSKPISTKNLLAAWSELTRYVHSIDPFKNPITIHPTQYEHKQLDNPKLLDINMLQTGHANSKTQIDVIKNTVKMIQIAQKQKMPVVVGEVCYEGIMEANRQEIQRCLFWASILSGAAGHTYGANGIWQLNRRDQAFGPSPYGICWGNTPWEDAYQLPGSKHVGVGKSILSHFPWWKLESHPDWVDDDLTFAAGIPNQLRIIYRFIRGRFRVKKLEKKVIYDAFWIDPKTGNQFPIGTISSDKKGNWMTPQPIVFQDWLLILKNKE